MNKFFIKQAREFAPGILDRSDLGDLSKLPVDQLVTLLRQEHQADRAGLHEDLRIGTTEGMYSWAVPKSLPVNIGEKRLAIQQPIHSYGYNQFEGVIPEGYGKGIVKKKEESPSVILKNSPNHIIFTRGDKKQSPVYDLIRTKDKQWLLSINNKQQPDIIKNYPKEHFKAVAVEEAKRLIEEGAKATPKIDGAGALAYLGPKGIEVYGIRSNKDNLKPEYTDIIGNLRGVQIPKELQGRVLRGELYGTKDGKVISANEIAGLLNSTVSNAVDKRNKSNTKLLLAALALHNNGVDQYDLKEVNKLVSKINNPFLQKIKQYSGKKALALLRDIKNKKNPLTSEGVVLHIPGKRPVKAKNVNDADVYIRNIFKADTENDSRAGGFEYSLTPTGKVIGRVGTGFNHKMLKDMLNNPDKYIGRTARIHSQEQYPSGAYRAPGFIAIKED